MKRLNEGVKSFEELTAKSSLLFKYEPSEYKFKFFYLDKEDEKIEITKEEDFQEVVKYHLSESQNLMKIQLEVEKINVDEMLRNIKLSESFNSETFQNVPIINANNQSSPQVPLENNEEANKNKDDIFQNLNEEKQKEENDCLNRSNMSRTLIIQSSPKKEEVEKEDLEIKKNLNESNEFSSYVEVKNEENKLSISMGNNNINLESIKSQKNEEVQVDSHKNMSNASTQKPEIMKDQDVYVNYDDQKLNNDEEKQSNCLIKHEVFAQQVSSHQISSNSQNNIELNNNNNKVIVNSFDEKEFLQKVDDLISKKLNNLEEKFISNVRQSNMLNNNQIEEQKSVPQKEEIKQNHKEIRESNVDQKQKLEIFRQTCDMCSKCPILGPKYYCILCTDMVICGDCENKHNHPVIKFNNELITNKDQLMKLMYLAANKNEGNLLHKLVNKIENSSSIEKIQSIFKNSNLKAELHCDYKNGIIIKPECSFTLSLDLSNNCSKKLPAGIKILPLNNRDLEIQPFITDFELEPKQYVKIDIKCKSPSRNDNYKIKFIVYHNNVNINSTPMILDVIVGVDENERLNEFFAEFETIIKLPKEKKKVIFDVINDQLSNKSPEMIRRILEKYHWKVEFALDELMLEAGENQGNK